jgi:hypothetical protein
MLDRRNWLEWACPLVCFKIEQLDPACTTFVLALRHGCGEKVFNTWAVLEDSCLVAQRAICAWQVPGAGTAWTSILAHHALSAQQFLDAGGACKMTSILRPIALAN